MLPGMLISYGSAAVPGGFLSCDGSAVSRTTYAALFAAIGIAYGPGDGSTTFNVPDLRDAIPVGLGPAYLPLGAQVAGPVDVDNNKDGSITSVPGASVVQWLIKT